MRRFFGIGVEAEADASQSHESPDDGAVEDSPDDEPARHTQSTIGTLPKTVSTTHSPHRATSFHTAPTVETMSATESQGPAAGIVRVSSHMSSLELSSRDSAAPQQLFRSQIDVLHAYARDVRTEEPVRVVDVLAALKDIAETMVWADQNDATLWDVFLELAAMPLLVRCLHATKKKNEARELSRSADGGADEEDTSTTNDESEGQGDECVVEVKPHAAGGGDSPDSEAEDPELDREFTGLGKGAKLGVELACGADNSRMVFSGEVALPAQNSESEVGGRDEVEKTGTSKGVASIQGSSRPASAASVAASLLAEVTEDERTSETNDSAEIAGEASEDSRVQAQILQTISIIIQSVSRQESLVCLFSSNHINDILSFRFAFGDDEVLAYFISAVKSIALKLDPGLLQLFFDPLKGTFPLYTAVTNFYDHPESMIRIAVRNVTLTIYALGDLEVLRYAARDENLYLEKTVELLAKLCGSVARAFELLLDDGREVRRTRSRTGIFRRRVKTPELTAKVEEVENLFAYLGDVSVVSQAYLHSPVITLISTRLFSPFFRPLASRASSAAVQLLLKRWRTRVPPTAETRPALPLFDAAARCLVLACILVYCRSSPLGPVLVRDLCRPTAEFEQRHVLHGLKAMATDITGTERMTFISLCTMEAFINCQAASKQLLSTLQYDFSVHDAEQGSGPNSHGRSVLNLGVPDEDDLDRRGVQPLLMTLSDFDIPATPPTSRPSTPTFHQGGSASSIDDFKVSPNGYRGDSRASSFDSIASFNLSPQTSLSPSFDRTSSDGILSSFQSGEASLREAVSSIVLVVRRREVRTLRVMHAVCRLITAAERKTADVHSSVDVVKIILDELARVMQAHLKSKRTTIVSIEQMFDNFKSFAVSHSPLLEVAQLEEMLSPDVLPRVAADFPAGTGKRRRVHDDEAAPPVEVEDARTFFVMAQAYDNSLRSAGVLDRLGGISQKIHDALNESGVDDSYLDKRDTLEVISGVVLKHGEVA